MELEPEQSELLTKFVEAHRSVPREQRGAFIALDALGDFETLFLHPSNSASFKGSRSDAEILAAHGLLLRGYAGRDASFGVTPAGVAAYRSLKESQPSGQVVEADVRRFLDSSEFQHVHSAAFGKWQRAANLLWADDSKEQLTNIGHLCREALQDFAGSLARAHDVNVSHIDPQNTVQRFKAILAPRREALGKTFTAFLDALLVYWGTVIDLVQRQEHGGQREKEPLSWEDGRRVVFQTCVVMYEISRALGAPTR